MSSVSNSRLAHRRLDGVFFSPAEEPEPVTTRPPKRRDFPKVSRWIKSFFSLSLVLICLYLLVSPFLPDLSYKIARTFPSLVSPLPDKNQDNAAFTDNPDKRNRLVIESIGVDNVILEGKNSSTLDKGIWHRPNTSTPDKGGNTVITAHRFKYLSGNNTFYHLDKLKVGDTIKVTWNQKIYNYKVAVSKIVAPNDTTVEAANTQPILTLYTCTPLWTSQKRLVVQADLID